MSETDTSADTPKVASDPPTQPSTPSAHATGPHQCLDVMHRVGQLEVTAIQHGERLERHDEQLGEMREQGAANARETSEVRMGLQRLTTATEQGNELRQQQIAKLELQTKSTELQTKSTEALRTEFVGVVQGAIVALKSRRFAALFAVGVAGGTVLFHILQRLIHWITQ